MKIFKGKYGWSTSAHSKDKDGNEVKCYVDVNFKKGTEPIVEPMEGELIFRESNGNEWPAFFSSYMKQNVPLPKLVLMPTGSKPKVIPKNVQSPLVGNDGRDMFHVKREPKPEDVVIDPDELPFY